MRDHDNERPSFREVRPRRPISNTPNARDGHPDQRNDQRSGYSNGGNQGGYPAGNQGGYQGRQPNYQGAPRPRFNRKPPLQVMLVTRDIANPDDVDKRVIDYNNQDTATWLYRHTQWALYNNKTTLLLPYNKEEDFDKVEDYDIAEFDELEPEEYDDEEDEG